MSEQPKHSLIVDVRGNPYGEQPDLPEKRDEEPQNKEYGTTSERKEEIENRSALEQVHAALVELRKILEFRDGRSKEAARIRHTIDAVESALAKLEKEGPNKGRYKVEMIDEYGRNSEQYEGVPVDELIDILNSEVKKVDQDYSQRLVDL